MKHASRLVLCAIDERALAHCSMSASGQKLPRRLKVAVSALPPKAAATFVRRRGS